MHNNFKTIFNQNWKLFGSNQDSIKIKWINFLLNLHFWISSQNSNAKMGNHVLFELCFQNVHFPDIYFPIEHTRACRNISTIPLVPSVIGVAQPGKVADFLGQSKCVACVRPKTGSSRTRLFQKSPIAWFPLHIVLARMWRRRRFTWKLFQDVGYRLSKSRRLTF